MKRALLCFAPFLLAANTCSGPSSGGTNPSGGGNSPNVTGVDDTGAAGSTVVTGVTLPNCDPEFTSVAAYCFEDTTTAYFGKGTVWRVEAEVTTAMPWINVRFDGTSLGGNILETKGGHFEGDLSGLDKFKCDEPHEIELESVLNTNIYRCDFSYTP